MKKQPNPTTHNIPILKIVVLAACLTVSIVSILTIYQRQSVFMYVALSVIVAILTLVWSQIKSFYLAIMKRRAGRITVRVIVICFIVAAVYSAVISVLMIGAMLKKPSEDATLIVLGCQVRGEQPSLMLHRRIDAALGYMQGNPDTVAVLSGGQGEGEFISEAEAIFRQLTANGIDENRLFLESFSTSTYENIAFSKDVITAYGLSTDVAVVTDGFHQYRAQFYASRMGLEPAAVSSKTPFYVVPYYWLREIAAITAQVVLGMNVNA